MKRNETALVYGVTGILLAILVVAIVFGNDDSGGGPGPNPGPASPKTAAQGLEELMNVNPAGALGNEDSKGVDPEALVAADPDAADPDAADPDAADLVAADLVAADSDVADHADETGIVPVPLNHRARVEERMTLIAGFGPSRRERDYRIVAVRAEDTFNEIVLRWCGSLKYIVTAKALNEGLQLNHLIVGREICLPWVEDEIIVVAEKERRAAAAKPPIVMPVAAPASGTSSGGVASAVDASSSKAYVVKSGDALWKIAVRFAGSGNKAPAFIDQLKKLNPGLDPDHLMVGQKIKLPQKPR